MNRFERRITLRVLAIHAAVILFLFLQSTLQGCFRPEPKPEIVTFIEFGEPAPTPVIEEVSEMPEPEHPTPAPQEQVETPVPVKIPDPIPTPTKPTVEPVKKVQPPKVEPKKPKWEPVDPSQIKIGKKVPVTPVKPVISQSDIRKELSDIVKPSATPGNPNEISAYDAHIHSAFYKAWAQPAVAAARSAKVTIAITATGRIKTWRLSQSSGDPEYDATVESAVRKISILPKKPPAGYPLNNIVINFSIN